MYLLKLSLFSCCGLILILWAGCDNVQKEQKKYVLAKVGKETLTLDEVMTEIPKEIRSTLSPSDIREYVRRWTNNEVLYQEARRRKLDERIDLKMEFEKLKREILINKLIEVELDNDVPVTEEEIKSYFESNKDSFVLTEDVVHAYHILVKTRKEANTIRKRLRSGETFEALSKEVNSNSETNDWDLGYFSRDEVIPEISKVVFNMPIGALSFPIKSDFGYHILKLVDKQNKGDTEKFETVIEEIRLKLEAQKKQERFHRFLLQMKSKTLIETNLRLLDQVNLDSLTQIGN
ncbi:MAG: peptidyl-prolyl cis-trans isomerase [bacterium]